MACLIVCPGCARHLKAHEPGCPFCGAAIHGAACAPESLADPTRYPRVWLAAAIVTSASASGCPVYGLPCRDSTARCSYSTVNASSSGATITTAVGAGGHAGEGGEGGFSGQGGAGGNGSTSSNGGAGGK